MKKAMLGVAVVFLSISSAFADSGSGSASSPETAGNIAGLTRACGTQRDPALREFIRQSMATIESRAGSADELAAAMRGFVGAFADAAFAVPTPADCAGLEARYGQAYRRLQAEQFGRRVALHLK